MESTDGNKSNKAIVSEMATEVFEDMEERFLPHKLPWIRDGQTWIMLRRGQEVRSWMEYILGTDRCLFQNMDVRDPRHNTNQYMVLGRL